VKKFPLIGIFGSTASGKSKLALELAVPHHAAILNADSVQIYKGLEVGSAKPTPEERESCPHYLFDIVNIGEGFAAGDYQREVVKTIEQLQRARQTWAFLVGGSGFYIQTLTRGIYPIAKSDPLRRQQIEDEAHSEGGQEALFQELMALDPVYAQKIGPADLRRIVRALEIFRSNDGGFKSFAELESLASQRRPPVEIHGLVLYRQKEKLREAITQRAHFMLEHGFIEEVQGLLEQVGPHWGPLKSVGYREVVNFLEGLLSKDLLLESIVKSTLYLAKRQVTWFKRETGLVWFDADKEWEKALQYGQNLINTIST